ncbi:MAG: hypothetical protein ACI965_002042, partial [Paraglaciecola sp.]
NIHGWVYDLHDGLIKDIQVTTASRDALDDIYQLHETSRGSRHNA